MDLDAFTAWPTMRDAYRRFPNAAVIGTVVLPGRQACIPCGSVGLRRRWGVRGATGSLLDRANRRDRSCCTSRSWMSTCLRNGRLVKQALAAHTQVAYDYDGTDHGFNRFGYPPYHPQAAAAALSVRSRFCEH